MRPLLDHVPADGRLSVDLTGLSEAFGANGSAAGKPDRVSGHAP
jgi:hypothetical protein